MIEITTLSELTIDGKLALHRTSSSKELFDYSTDELKAWFHGQRALSDAIMVGANTVRVDDPQLTVRHVTGPNPLRVIPSSDGLLPLSSALLNDGLPTLVATAKTAQAATVAALTAKPGVEVVCCGETEVDLAALAKLLAARGVKRLIVEGGSTLLSSLFGHDLVSKIIIKHIPIISGDPDAPTYLTLTPRPGLNLGISRWRMDDWFVKGGIGVSIYGREAAP
ncbi:MAG: bifunctional deaminase-reductase domain protein [Phenylobacterium sp.]|jgi:riboflavin-specific deaminase-like protein|uniref:RibD family protein n=1 Tax=Phenylobacterium sp. TaxID=1871053 RepID=UPI0026068778|nr:RibD family protein [Phenylobacterium sp.]MDB5426959.1 bifunctional deaminase-reductase domain protein [Phenylobacterium sp.]MDB5433942.1 bifunctional deaminase-reductase domain protein [Phenylobacterium sp.]MDB5464797.1 bifunctional deaminase-reductase domain protein [Phenylobacterium sp.]MDB5497789.1 bifunctional deaminase-reductase domain protein [Phenylobacterium sp.]